MPRYFIEVSYKGEGYAGFQAQDNANTIQAEVEKALKTYYKQEMQLTGSSRTDTGVHALSNYLHFDTEIPLTDIIPGKSIESQVYHLNAILPRQIVIKDIIEVKDTAHSRFDARSREYKYYIYTNKDPFVEDRAFYFPYHLEEDKLQEAASVLLQHQDFSSFSKRNTQVKTFNCNITKSRWTRDGELLIFTVVSNRFLRGMVRGLVGTMLRVGRGKISVEEFEEIILAKDCTKVDFSVPPQGLFLVNIRYPDELFI